MQDLISCKCKCKCMEWKTFILRLLKFFWDAFVPSMKAWFRYLVITNEIAFIPNMTIRVRVLLSSFFQMGRSVLLQIVMSIG